MERKHRQVMESNTSKASKLEIKLEHNDSLFRDERFATVLFDGSENLCDNQDNFMFGYELIFDPVNQKTTAIIWYNTDGKHESFQVLDWKRVPIVWGMVLQECYYNATAVRKNINEYFKTYNHNLFKGFTKY